MAAGMQSKYQEWRRFTRLLYTYGESHFSEKNHQTWSGPGGGRGSRPGAISAAAISATGSSGSSILSAAVPAADGAAAARSARSAHRALSGSAAGANPDCLDLL